MIGSLLSAPLQQLLKDFPGLLSLSDLMNKKGSELTKNDVARIMRAFGFEGKLTPGLEAAFRGLIEGHNIHKICDCIQDPESMIRLARAARALIAPVDLRDSWQVPGLKLYT